MGRMPETGVRMLVTHGRDLREPPGSLGREGALGEGRHRLPTVQLPGKTGQKVGPDWAL